MYPDESVLRLLARQLTDFQRRDELAECHDQEVEVEEELELLIKHHRKKSQNAVLLITNDVGRVL